MEIQKNASIIGWPLSSASVAAHARNMQPLFLMRNRKLFGGSDAAVLVRNMQAAFADKNAAEFPHKRANDGSFFLMILRAHQCFFLCI